MLSEIMHIAKRNSANLAADIIGICSIMVILVVGFHIPLFV